LKIGRGSSSKVPQPKVSPSGKENSEQEGGRGRASDVLFFGILMEKNGGPERKGSALEKKAHLKYSDTLGEAD